MSNFIITKSELYQILKKRLEETDQLDAKNIEEENINEIIIENETEKFFELFNKIFLEEEEQLDSEDGLIDDLFGGIVTKIKEKLKSINSSHILKLVVDFFKKHTGTNIIDGKDKSSCA